VRTLLKRSKTWRHHTIAIFHVMASPPSVATISIPRDETVIKNIPIVRTTYLGLSPGINKHFHAYNILSAVLLVGRASIGGTKVEGDEVLVVDQ